MLTSQDPFFLPKCERKKQSGYARLVYAVIDTFSGENTPADQNISLEEAQYCSWQYLNMIQSLEHKIESKFSEFNVRLCCMERDILSLKSKESDAVCSESGSSGHRKKRSPPELQVCDNHL